MTADAAPAADVQPKAKVFISYSRKDMAFADRLEAALKARGFQVLIDRAEIYAFEDWWKRIQALIAQADTVIFLLSPGAVASPVCAKEVTFAASLNKRFAPTVLRRVDDKQVPEALSRLNFIFFDDEVAVCRQSQSALRCAGDRYRLDQEAYPIRRSRPQLGRRRPPQGASAALADVRGGRALDCLAAIRRADAN